MRTVATAIDVNAPPAEVGGVLGALSGYPEWNPVFREAVGTVAVGNTLTMKAYLPGRRPMSIKVKVVSADPGKEIRWTGGMTGLISGDHSFVLSAIDGGGTHVDHREVFSGLLSGVGGKIFDSAQAGYRDLNEALKKHIEPR